MMVPSKVLIVQVWGYLHIEHDPLTHMVATLDSSLDLSLFDDAHWPFSSFLVGD